MGCFRCTLFFNEGNVVFLFQLQNYNNITSTTTTTVEQKTKQSTYFQRKSSRPTRFQTETCFNQKGWEGEQDRKTIDFNPRFIQKDLASRREFLQWHQPLRSLSNWNKELLKRSKIGGVALGDQESLSTTTEPMTATTSTESPKPIKCDLAGTIEIVGGVKWKPELLEHNTLEYKNLAEDVGKLKKW